MKGNDFLRIIIKLIHSLDIFVDMKITFGVNEDKRGNNEKV